MQLLVWTVKLNSHTSWDMLNSLENYGPINHVMKYPVS